MEEEEYTVTEVEATVDMTAMMKATIIMACDYWSTHVKR